MLFNLLERHRDKWVEDGDCYRWTAGTSCGQITRSEKSRYQPRIYVGNRKMATVSRLMCEEAHGPPSTPKHHAAHDTPNGCIGSLCVNGEHLRWATASENQFDVPVEVRRTRVVHDAVNRGARYEAQKIGSKTYLSNNPCPRGHTGLRYTRNGACRECEMTRRDRK